MRGSQGAHDAPRHRDPEPLWRTIWGLSLAAYAAAVVVLVVTPVETERSSERRARPALLVDLMWPRLPGPPQRLTLDLPAMRRPPPASPATAPVEPPPLPFPERLAAAAELDGWDDDSEPMASRGCLSADAVAPALEALEGRARRCYEMRLARGSQVAGTLVTTLLVDHTGAVADAHIAGGSLTDPELASCLLGELREQRFPACDGGVAEITRPWSFSPKRM